MLFGECVVGVIVGGGVVSRMVGLSAGVKHTVVVSSDNFTCFIYVGVIPFCHYSPFIIIYYNIHACQCPTTPSFIITPQTT